MFIWEYDKIRFSSKGYVLSNLVPQCLSWFPSYCTGLKPNETASGYIQDIIATVVPLGISCQSDHFVVPKFYG